MIIFCCMGCSCNKLKICLFEKNLKKDFINSFSFLFNSYFCDDYGSCSCLQDEKGIR